jgi:ribosomal protein S12 methylthiotransferase accessory factor
MADRRDSVLRAYFYSNLGGTLNRRTSLDELANRSNGDPLDDLRHAVSLVGDAGYEVIVVNLTTVDAEDLGLHVLRVLIPGAQPLDASYKHRFLGGRRLYEVPERIGLPGAQSIDELNPWPHPYP